MGGAQGREDVEVLENPEEDLMRMAIVIPVTHLDDIPLCVQRHTTSVGSHFSYLLKKVARAIICYIGHHQDEKILCSTYFLIISHYVCILYLDVGCVPNFSMLHF